MKNRNRWRNYNLCVEEKKKLTEFEKVNDFIEQRNKPISR